MVQDAVRRKHGYTVKTCWIADVKERIGLNPRVEHNRCGPERTNPCPPEKVAAIVEAFRSLGVS